MKLFLIVVLCDCADIHAYSAVFILALVITVALLISRSGDVDELEDSPNDSPGRVLNSTDFLILMQSNPFPIEGTFNFLFELHFDLSIGHKQ